jgi:hypothetical protein
LKHQTARSFGMAGITTGIAMPRQAFLADTTTPGNQRISCKQHFEETGTIASRLSGKRNGNTSTFGTLQTRQPINSISCTNLSGPKNFLQLPLASGPVFMAK